MHDADLRDGGDAACDAEILYRDVNGLVRDVGDIPPDAIQIIRARLARAAFLMERVTPSAHPASERTFWPALVRSRHEIEEVERETPEEDRVKPVSATARQVSQAEEALAWREYVTEAYALAALNIWLRCKARRIRSWKKDAVRHGFSKGTADRSLARALFMIAVGLMRDGREIEPPH